MTIAWLATRLASALDRHDLIFIADDEQQAERLAAALHALREENPVFHVPSSDALPGDVTPASPANIGARVAALRGLRAVQSAGTYGRIACIISGEAAARRYPLPTAFDDVPPHLSVGDSLDLPIMTAQLVALGYYVDDRVDEPGEMAIRGDVIDIFPADCEDPVRIEIAQNKIVALRSYDPVTQRSLADLDTIAIGRAVEPPIGEACSILAHVPAGLIYFSAQADNRRRRFLQLADDAAQGRSQVDAVDQAQWMRDLSSWRRETLADPEAVLPRFAQERSPLGAFARYVTPLLASGKRLVLAGSERDVRFLHPKITKRLGLAMEALTGWAEMVALEAGKGGRLVMPVDSGFVADDLILVAATDLLGSRAVLEDGVSGPAAPWATDSDLRIGDIVVHEDHGIGRIAGLEPAPVAQGSAVEMIALDYAGGGRRLVDHDEAGRIWRYGGDSDAVTLDRLDGSSWQKRRGDIDAAIAHSARGLAKLAQDRAKREAGVIDPDPALYERFAGTFPFNETADQARAIAVVRDDLASGRPMDRLVVGDVGYGKTEVALRAAALTALAGRQVVVAAPTTVLVRQHLATFSRRFEGTGIKIESLSRLSSAAEKKAVKAGLADGSIRIVIGTGAVMAKGVSYANRALVIIDEEQRFGAADKARLRGGGETHLLSLSATPIPRTLQMALVGLQQISLITTPPARRQPIRTSIDVFDDVRIRTALLREKSRGGQSFIVTPRIEDLPKLAERVRRIVPDLDVVQAHGKMRPSELDAVMVGFADGQGDILLATNIIEAGLDVPRANTMIVWRADRFGLAQLHQLRGRVGRGNRRGQVILLTEAEKAIGERTLKRLRALAAFDRLGAGFQISAQDLDMRGAGDLLGEAQAGHMKLIGVDLYQHLLGAALREVRGETVDDWMPDLKIGAGGGLPDDWIPEPDLRLSLYVRLARMADAAGLELFEEELLDRFGPLPEAAQRLILGTRLRLAAKVAGLSRVDAGPAAIALTPRRPGSVDAKTHGLVVKGERLLLIGEIPESERIDRTLALIEALVP